MWRHHEPAPEHDHPRHPEKQDVEAGNHQRIGIKHFFIPRRLRPPERSERQQARRKPRVEHVRILLQLRAAALACRRRLARHHHFLALAAIPCRNPVSPPQLPRDAPVVDVTHPVQVNLPVILRRKTNVSLLHHFDGALRQRRNLDEPLRREPRLDNRARAIALAERNRVILCAHQKTLLREILHHMLSRGKAIQSRVRTGIRIHLGVLVDHFNLRQVVPEAGLEVVGIMRRCHLHRAGAELRLRQFVRDDRDLTIHQRQHHMLAVQMRVALVLRIHRDRRVAQHRLRTRGRHRDEFGVASRAAHHRVPNLVQLARDVFVLHFEVRDRGPAVGAPVHDVFPAINQPIFIEPHERFFHRMRQVVVHGEVFAAPIDRRSQPLHLVEDRAAILPLPFPHPLNELLAPQVAPLLAFFQKLALHHHLRRNARMVRPRQPERDKPAHAMPAHQNIHLRLVQHVPHVQPPRHIWRRQQQGEHRTRISRRRRLHVKQLFLNPILGPARFNRARFVSFRQFVRHVCPDRAGRPPSPGVPRPRAFRGLGWSAVPAERSSADSPAEGENS